MKSYRTLLALTCGLASALFCESPVTAQGPQPPYTATSRITWGFGVDANRVITGTTTGGSFTLGRQFLRFGNGGTTVITLPPRQWTYAQQAGSTVGYPLQRTLGGTTCKADSTMTVRPKTGGVYPWRLQLDAESDTFPVLRPLAGVAVAQGKDPQYIAHPGFFDNTLSIDAGSILFASPGASAAATMKLTAPDLNQPLAFVDVWETPTGKLMDTVKLASDPHLSFFQPGTSIPITNTQVEQEILQDSGLGSASGSVSDLSLFTYQYDLTGAKLGSQAALGEYGQAIARTPSAGSVPEASTLTLFGLCLIGSMGSFAWRRRRDATSQPSC